ncbi:Remorin, C-terminal region [Musa troglodytarum]|nr:Remorin, C-terminal region [Musa troglodytarum]
MGVISPSKLRIKLLGTHGGRRKEGGNSSSRTSPSKLEEMEHSKHSLLAGDLDEEVSLKDSKDESSLNVGASSEVPRLELSVKEVLGYGQGDQTPSFRKEFLPKGKADICCNGARDTVKSVNGLVEPTSNLSMVHPMRLPDEESFGYDSGHDNGSARSFEFHKGERPLQQASSPFVRNLPSKWNDAERWIVHRQITHVKSNVSKKTAALNLGSLQVISNRVVFVPESVSADRRHYSLTQEPDAKTSSSTKSTAQNVAEKFSFAPNSSQSSLDSTMGLTDLSSVNSTYGGCFKKEFNHAVSENSTTKATVSPLAQSVSMRDVGTEMTPIPSQDPSRTETPVGATTPVRTPLSSIPTSPKKGAQASSAAEANTHDQSRNSENSGNRELSDKELQLKTRREIAALGIQLGKMNIASWASKDDLARASPPLDEEKIKKTEYEARAAAWEESQKSEYTARHRQEEAKIQAWENHQKAKYETKLRRVEAQAEQMKARAQDKLVEKLSLTRRRVEHKQAVAEAKRNRRAARTAQQVEQIRQTGRVYTTHIWCCSWFF